MADPKDEKIKSLEERLKKLESDNAKTDLDSLQEYIEGKEKLLSIEMKMAKAIGDSKGEMAAAKELSDLWKSSNAGAYEENSEKAKEFADRVGLGTDRVKELLEKLAMLGPVGAEAYDSMKAGAEDVAQKMFLVSKQGDAILKGMAKIGKFAQDPKGIKGMAMALKDTFKPSRIAASFLMKFVQSTFFAMMAADKASSAFAKQTGLGRMATKEINSLALGHANLGITMDDSAKINAALITNMNEFKNLSADTKDELGVLVGGLDKFGVGAEEGAKMIETFRKSLGATTDEAMQMTRDVALAAKGIGVSMSMYVKGFNSANKSLAVYGAAAPRIFGKIAAAARAAGVETDALLGLASKFDTFSDAAETTGKLNAILGTQMSSMDLLTMKEDERIEYLLKNIQLSGKQFKNMDRFTQKAVAQAAGISDMAQANKIFGMSFGEYKRNQRAMSAQSKEQETMEQRMKDAMSVVDKLKTIMMNFAISMEPMIPVIRSFVEGFSDFMQSFANSNIPMKGLIASLVIFAPLLAPLLGILVPLAGAMFSFVGGLTTMAFASKGGKKAVESLSKPVGQLGVSMAPLAGSAAAIGFGVLMMGAGMALAAFGVALMVEQLVLMAEHGKLAIGILFGFAGALFALSLAAAAMANPFTMIGMGLLIGVLYNLRLMAEAQAAMAGSVTESISGFGSLASTLKESVTQFSELAFADFFGVFAGLILGIQAFKSALSLEDESNIKVSHTLENLALIATGKSAGTINGNLGSSIVAAIDRIGASKEKQTIRIEVDEAAIKSLMEKGYFELVNE